VYPLAGIAADRDGYDGADRDADGDAAEQRPAAAAFFGRL
jgi:hypothetical protein